MRMVFSPVRTRATAAGRDMAAYREIVTKERRVTVSRGQALAAYGPHPGEPAPKSGLPDFGNQKVSKSATADFDAGVSKNGSKQRNRLLPISAIFVPKSGKPDFGCGAIHASRRRCAPPRDEVD